MSSYPPPDHVLTALGIEVRRGADRVWGRASVDPALLARSVGGAVGGLRPGVGALVPIVDIVSGTHASRHTDGDWLATSDLWIGEVAPLGVDGGRIEVGTRLLRAGGRSIVVGCDVTQGGRPVATSTAEFTRIRRSASRHTSASAVESDEWRRFGNGPALAEPVDRACHIELLDADAGVARLAHHGYVSNSIETIQGGAAALLADTAAAAMLGPTGRVVDLLFRFLAQTAAGPAETSGTVVRRDTSGVTVTIDVVDASTATLVGWATARVVADRPS